MFYVSRNGKYANYVSILYPHKYLKPNTPSWKKRRFTKTLYHQTLGTPGAKNKGNSIVRWLRICVYIVPAP